MRVSVILSVLFLVPDVLCASGYYDVNLCVNFSSTEQCARAKEKKMLQNLPDQLNREGNVLQLKMNDESFLTLENKSQASEVDQNFSYYVVDYYPDFEIYRIHVQLWESNKTLLLHRGTKNKALLDATPIFSPNGKKLVTSDCAMPSYGVCRTEIWSVQGGNFEKEASFKEMAYTGLQWTDEETLEGFRTLFVLGEPLLQYYRAVFKEKGNEWIEAQRSPLPFENEMEEALRTCGKNMPLYGCEVFLKNLREEWTEEDLQKGCEVLRSRKGETKLQRFFESPTYKEICKRAVRSQMPPM